MAFVKLPKPKRTTATATPQVTISTNAAQSATYLFLNQAAKRALGNPAAVYLAYDRDTNRMQVHASSPDDPAAYAFSARAGRVAVTAILRELGFAPAKTTYHPAKKTGRLALEFNLDEVARAGAPIEIVKAA
ncbi:hypothetical protein DHOM_02740 [Dermabacter hominis 1368]|uniref:Uncharacterized protein n=1 Tax=Dermabacter hominis 1368 TaxID=1450519 RepID=A0ABR4SNH8_9MICO|nr:hypothetical protein DHOM_02740 [Dermabacter hominis 1368]